MSGAIKQHILLVDDEPQVLVALEDLLSDRFVISKADSAQHALNVMEHESDIAVVVTDQRMPAMNGDEMLAKLGASHDALRILVTGYADLSAVIRAVNDGQIFAYVTKPWNAEDLRLKVSKAAEQFKLAQELAAERKRLHEQTRVLNSILDSMGDGVIVTDRLGKFLIFNPEAKRILGVVPGDFSFGEWTRACGIYEMDQKTPLWPTHNPLFLAMAGEEPEEAELFISNAVVPGASVAMTATPLKDDENVLAGGIALLRDVTERRQLERQLLQSQKMEAIGQLAGGVAHDFNNLLAIIQSYGEFVLDDLPEGDAKRDDMSELLGATQRASALTKQLLAFSRQQPMRTIELDLNELVANIEKMLRRLIGSGIDLVTKLSPEVGFVRGDASQMEQIILNLAINARDAMSGTGRLVIETSRTVLTGAHEAARLDGVTGAFVVLSVTDTGMGMDSEVQKRIFEPFYTTKEVGKGTGLGLSTVYGIVRQSGGHIEVDSVVSEGTCFRIYLPLLPEASTGDARPSVAPMAFGHETVLVIEDEEAVRRVATRILRERGYSVLEAATVAEARRLFLRHASSLDLILADLVMPEMSGPQLVKELTMDQPQMRVLYMSGHAGPMGAGEGVVDSEAAYIEKPFTPNGLAGAVRAALARDPSI